MHRPIDDLVSTREAIARNTTSAAAEIEKSIAVATSPACDAVFVKTSFDTARRAAAAGTGLPLAGLAVSVKDLFDVEGEVTTAG